MTVKELTPKQARFVAQYLIDNNAKQAAIRAGYSKDTAVEQGSRLLTYVHVMEAIKAGQAKIANKLEITAERVAAELAKIGFSNIQDYSFDDYGHVDLAEGSDDEAIKAVSSIKRKKFCDKDGNDLGVETEIKLWDKPRALEMLARHLGMFDKDKLNLDGQLTITWPLPRTELDN